VAVASPIPDAPPVTTATLPAIDPMVLPLASPRSGRTLRPRIPCHPPITPLHGRPGAATLSAP